MNLLFNNFSGIKYFQKKWLCLLLLGLNFSLLAQEPNAPKQELILDHFYIVLDQESYDFLFNLEFLHKKFASKDSGLPTFEKPDNKTTVLYLRGEDIYIELMSPQNKFGVKQGTIGLGFSWNPAISEDLEKLKTIKEEIEHIQKKEVAISTRNYTFDEEKTDWFSSLYFPTAAAKIYAWWSVYSPNFLEKLTGKKHLVYDNKEYLKNIHDNNKFFRSVKSLAIQLSGEDYQRLTEEFSVFELPFSTVKNGLKHDFGNLELKLLKGTQTKIDSISLELFNKQKINSETQKQLNLINQKLTKPY